MARKHVHLPVQAEAADDASLPASSRASAGGMTSLATADPPQVAPSHEAVDQREAPTDAAQVPGRLRRACTFMAIHAAKGAVSSAGGLLVTALWVYLSHR
ncbi:hypothetical protein AB0O51_26845 [Streptomyces sp. NPDC090301]|uniref:hypothetical protein n=1 Tax=Streptomyces sp. NPDC090301 TaxID=3154975 RepID=UPI0034141CAB